MKTKKNLAMYKEDKRTYKILFTFFKYLEKYGIREIYNTSYGSLFVLDNDKMISISEFVDNKKYYCVTCNYDKTLFKVTKKIVINLIENL